VAFRVADTLWRSESATNNSDSTRFDQSRERLEVLSRETDPRDPVWVEVQESLADFYWTRRETQNWSEAWPQLPKGV